MTFTNAYGNQAAADAGLVPPADGQDQDQAAPVRDQAGRFLPADQDSPGG